MTERSIGDLVRKHANEQIHNPFMNAVVTLARAHLGLPVTPQLIEEVNIAILRLHHQYSIAAGCRLRLIRFTLNPDGNGHLSMHDLADWKPEPYP